MDSAKQKFNEAYDKTKNTAKEDRPDNPNIPKATNLHPSKDTGNEVTPGLSSTGTSGTDKEKHGGGGGLLSSMFSGSGGDAAR